MSWAELTIVDAISEHAAIDRAIAVLQEESERTQGHWSSEKARIVQREALLQRSAQLNQFIRTNTPSRRLDNRLRTAFLLKNAIHRRDGLQHAQQILDEAIAFEATIDDVSSTHKDAE